MQTNSLYYIFFPFEYLPGSPRKMKDDFLKSLVLSQKPN